MPESNEPSAQVEPSTAQPVAQPKPQTKVPTTLGLIVILALAAVCYSYVTKYKETKTTLDQTQTSLITTKLSLTEAQSSIDSYKKLAESRSSFKKTPYMYNGKLVVDDKGNPVYTITYIKNTSSTTANNSAVTTNVTQAVTQTQSSTTVTHQVTDVQSGVKTQGQAYVALPGDIFLGKLGRIGVGVEHNFFFGTGIGVEAGTNDVTNLFGSAYVDLHLGYQIP